MEENVTTDVAKKKTMKLSDINSIEKAFEYINEMKLEEKDFLGNVNSSLSVLEILNKQSLLKESNVLEFLVEMDKKHGDYKDVFLIKLYDRITSSYSSLIRVKFLNFIKDYCQKELTEAEISLDEIEIASRNRYLLESDVHKFADCVTRAFEYKCDGDEKLIGSRRRDALIISYLWLMCNRDIYNQNKNKLGLIIEKGLTTYFTNLDDEKLIACVANYFPQLISSKDFEDKLKMLSYLYYGVDERIANLHDDKEKLTNANEYLNNSNQMLKVEINKLNDVIKERQASIDKLELEISKAQQKQASAENMLQYETAKGEESYVEMKKSIKSRLLKDLKQPVENIRNTISSIDEEKAKKIERRLKEIERCIFEILGDE